MYANIATTVAQVAGAWALIQAFGLWGAVSAGLFAVLINTVLLYVFAERLYHIPFNFWRNAKVLALATLVYIVSRFTTTDYFALTILLKSSAICGFVMLLMLGRLLLPGEIAELRAFGDRMMKRCHLLTTAAQP
jgi:O-antigen/teichoic acid export membrane protein